jgi:hypothetical protein
MRDIHSAWPIIVGATEGVKRAEELSSYSGLDSLLCMYINSVASTLGLQHAFSGEVGNDGFASIEMSDSAEPFNVIAYASDFVKKYADITPEGELDFSAVLSEWLANIGELEDGEKFSLDVNSDFVTALVLDRALGINVSMSQSLEDIVRMSP